MGIKELWPILNPYCERKPLYELQGKVVAIDLAGWICESLCVVDYVVQAKFYLRNLFFRTCYLLLSGITPVFVLEGTAPVMKHQVIAKRNQIQFRGAKPRTATQQQSSASQSQATQKKGRTRFNYVLKQCEELIRSMGLHCVQGPGEAEAFCAHLNACGAVDGVISQDSDCFAYGAVRVFRNFSLSMQGSVGSIGGSVDVYDLSVVQRSIDFGRNKIVVMALLCGCDYCPEGVGGVGRDAVQKLFAMYSEEEILGRIKSWRDQDRKFTELEIKVDDKKICTNCGHYGRMQSHTKSGCPQCKMSKGCDASLWKDKRMTIKTELQIRKKAMMDEKFPSQEIIDEFLDDPDPVSTLQLDWGQPNIVKFVKMMGSMLQWDEIYCFQKVLPLLTRWQLHHYAHKPNEPPTRGILQPGFIKKKRTPKGIPSYEIVWTDCRGDFKHLIPDEQLQTFYTTNSKDADQPNADQLLWSTIEPIDLVEKAYPELVERYVISKEKPKRRKNIVGDNDVATKPPSKTRKPKTKANKANVEPSENEEQANEIIPKKRVKKTVKAAKKDIQSGKVTTLDRFLIQQNTNSMPYQSPKIKTTSKPMNLSAFSIDLNDSGDDRAIDLSQIIDNMVSKTPEITQFHGKKLNYDEIGITPKARFGPSTVELNDDQDDEFDQIVARKTRRSVVDRVKWMHSNLLGSGGPEQCSTPVLTKTHTAPEEVCDLTPVMEHTKHDRSSLIVTSFFAANGEHGDIDLFEMSVDFRNIVPDGEMNSDSEHSDADASNDSNVSSDRVSSNSVNIGENDTFDRLVGAGKFK